MSNQATTPDTDKLGETLAASPISMVLSDPNLPDNPLIFVNEAFEQTTLYHRDAALGRNCRFLQCEETDPEQIAVLREAVEAGDSAGVDIINKRADGSTFLNRLIITPLRADDGALVAYLGIQSPVGEGDTAVPRFEGETTDMLRELQHRVKNHLAMVVGLIRMQSRKAVTHDSFEALSHRVQSLALLYDELSPVGVGSVNSNVIPAGAYLSRIASTIGSIDGRASIRLNVDCDEVDLPTETAARLGLVQNELITNAYEHAFEGRDEGVIQLRLRRQGRNTLRMSVEDDGVGLPEGSTWQFSAPSIEQRQAQAMETKGTTLDTKGEGRRSGAGGSIVAAMCNYLDGELTVTSTEMGTIANLDLRY